MPREEQLEFLISELQKQADPYQVQIAYQVAGAQKALQAGKTPADEQQAFNVFRALCNMRMPGPVSDRFLKVQDDLLQGITAEKGITNGDTLKPSARDSRLSVWQGDITTLRADAIVDAANTQMLGCFRPLHNCIDNQIHTMAGVQLRNECARQIAQLHEHHGVGDDSNSDVTRNADLDTYNAAWELPVATPLITPGYNLPAENVVHVAGPIVTGALSEVDRHLLAKCYVSCLDIAAESGCKSIAFCCISTGVFMFPADVAAEIAVQSVQEYLDTHKGCTIAHVIFNVFKDSDLHIYQALLGK